jgi:hypothetical protein
LPCSLALSSLNIKRQTKVCECCLCLLLHLSRDDFYDVRWCCWWTRGSRIRRRPLPCLRLLDLAAKCDNLTYRCGVPKFALAGSLHGALLLYRRIKRRRLLSLGLSLLLPELLNLAAELLCVAGASREGTERDRLP